MKTKLIYALMITFLLSLSACGSTSTSSDPEFTESDSALTNFETESLPVEDPSLSETAPALPDNEPDDSTSLDSTNSLEDLNRQAEELADSSEEITEGELYDSITAIYADVVIRTNANNDLTIKLNLNHDTVETDSLAFFETIISICKSCALENESSNITFIMMVDSKFVTMVNFLNYASLGSFSTTEPVVLVSEYEETIKYIYSTLFSKNDISNQFN